MKKYVKIYAGKFTKFHDCKFDQKKIFATGSKN